VDPDPGRSRRRRENEKIHQGRCGRRGRDDGRIAGTADGAELVADKLPGTPSRLDPPGLTGRLISASLAAAFRTLWWRWPKVP
jgi:hypothetical protein